MSNCILDVGTTGDPTYAASAAAAAASGPAGPPPPTPNPTNVSSKQVVIGDEVSGNLAAIGDVDHYTFTAAAGQIIYLDQQSNQCLEVDVVAPTGSSVTRGGICNSIGPLTLATGRTYHLDIKRGNTAAGAYKFRLLAVPGTRTTAIAIGDTVSDTLQSKGAIDRYTFTARPGQVIYVDPRPANASKSTSSTRPASRSPGANSATASARSPSRQAARTASISIVATRPTARTGSACEQGEIPDA